MKPRDVRIVLQHGVYWVRYAEREKFTRHSAAQFDAKFSSLADVVKWVRDNPKLRLVD